MERRMSYSLFMYTDRVMTGCFIMIFLAKNKELKSTK